MFIKLTTLNHTRVFYNVNLIQSIEKVKVTGKTITKITVNGDPKLVIEKPEDIFLKISKQQVRVL